MSAVIRRYCSTTMQCLATTGMSMIHGVSSLSQSCETWIPHNSRAMRRAVLSCLPRLSIACIHSPAAEMVRCYIPVYYTPWPGSRWLPYAAAALLLPQMAHMQKEETEENARWHLLGLSSRRRVFFKYEKRIRELSPPDKVFDYFASVSQNDSRLMTPADLLNSLVAVYPPEGTLQERSGALKGDRRTVPAQMPRMIKGTDFFDQFDTDGDGYICFGEYLLIVTFLAIPLEDMDIIFSMFDDDNSGAISLAEFLHFTTSLQKRLHHVSPIKRTGLQTEAGEEGHGLLLTFFGDDGKQQLDLSHFSDFCRALHAELVWLEYLHYDHTNKGYISGASFAHSLVSHTHMQDIDRYLTTIDNMPQILKNIRVSWEDFRGFALLRQSAHRLAVALDFFFSTEGKIGREDFERAVEKVLGHGLPTILVDIIFAVFAADDGHLKYRDLLYSIQKREGNMIYSKQMLQLDPASDRSTFACLRACLLQGLR